MVPSCASMSWATELLRMSQLKDRQTPSQCEAKARNRMPVMLLRRQAGAGAYSRRQGAAQGGHHTAGRWPSCQDAAHRGRHSRDPAPVRSQVLPLSALLAAHETYLAVRIWPSGHEHPKSLVCRHMGRMHGNSGVLGRSLSRCLHSIPTCAAQVPHCHAFAA